MAGHLKNDARHVNKGTVTYNGYTAGSGAFSLPKVTHFVEQVGEKYKNIGESTTFLLLDTS